MPDLEYPAWIQRCDLSEPPPPAESELWDDHGTAAGPLCVTGPREAPVPLFSFQICPAVYSYKTSMVAAMKS